MKCKTCGFAASDAGVTVCPFCKAQWAVGTPLPVGMTPAYASQAALAGGVWPPPPTAVPAYPLSGYADMAAIQKQRQAGILMAILPLVVAQATASLRNLLPAPYGLVVWGVIILAGLYPHFRGCAHWAESKGYPRYEGRLLAIIGWLGILFLAIRRDKTRVPA